jgi:hypothetical protein
MLPKLYIGPRTEHDVAALRRAYGLKVLGEGKFCVYHYCGTQGGQKWHIVLKRFASAEERETFIESVRHSATLFLNLCPPCKGGWPEYVILELA